MLLIFNADSKLAQSFDIEPLYFTIVRGVNLSTNLKSYSVSYSNCSDQTSHLESKTRIKIQNWTIDIVHCIMHFIVYMRRIMCKISDILRTIFISVLRDVALATHLLCRSEESEHNGLCVLDSIMSDNCVLHSLSLLMVH